jgi:hypothetical protein
MNCGLEQMQGFSMANFAGHRHRFDTLDRSGIFASFTTVAVSPESVQIRVIGVNPR